MIGEESILAYRFKALNELLRTLVVFEVLDTEHDQIIVFKLTEIFDHLTLDEWLKLPINHSLQYGTLMGCDMHDQGDHLRP